MIDISVIIPAYNVEKYISKAIISIINQTEGAYEIIIIDDYSHDNTCQIVQDFAMKHAYIKVIKKDRNEGVSSARNRGIKESKGDWILFLDADDECSPSLLEKYMKKINTIKNNKVAIIYSAYQQINEQSQMISDVIFGKKLSGNEGFCDILIRNPIISPSGVLVKKEALLAESGFKSDLKYDEDVDLWLRILNNNYSVDYVDEPLSFIRRHSTNATSSMSISHQAEKMILKQYGLYYIKEKLFARDYPVDRNSLDFGLLLIRFEKWNECLVLLDEITINKNSLFFITYSFLRSLCLIKVENYADALEMYKGILSNNPEHGASLNNAGVIHSIVGKCEDASNLFTKALKIYPNYLDAKHNLKQLNEGQMEVSAYRFTMRELRPVLLSYSLD